VHTTLFWNNFHQVRFWNNFHQVRFWNNFHQVRFWNNFHQVRSKLKMSLHRLKHGLKIGTWNCRKIGTKWNCHKIGTNYVNLIHIFYFRRFYFQWWHAVKITYICKFATRCTENIKFENLNYLPLNKIKWTKYNV
jgi:hypothetical protein